jgi:hypothetical protein
VSVCVSHTTVSLPLSHTHILPLSLSLSLSLNHSITQSPHNYFSHYQSEFTSKFIAFANVPEMRSSLYKTVSGFLKNRLVAQCDSDPFASNEQVRRSQLYCTEKKNFTHFVLCSQTLKNSKLRLQQVLIV